MTLTVQRAFGGVYGAIEVFYRTLNPNELYPFLPGGIERADQQDYFATNGSVLLHPGESNVQFNITIIDDSEPEIDESMFVILEATELYSPAQSNFGE